MADNPTTPEGGDVIRDQDKIMLVLAYFGIFSLIPYLTVKDSEYVRWHAKQGLVLCGASFAWGIVGFLLNFIPFLGWCLYFCGFIGIMVVAVMGIVKAFEPKRWKIPVISGLAEKF